jgi:beta-lactamase regulating signal transducer with metallopeptidase domain
VSAISQIVTTAAGALAATVINALWQDALLVVCVWLLLRVWPGINAATRYAVWTATLVAAIVVPVATTLPFYSVPAASPAAHDRLGARHGTQQSEHAVAHTARATWQRVTAQTRGSSQRPTVLPPRVHITVTPLLGAIIALIWLLLAAYALARLIIGLTRLEQLKRDALPLPVEYRDAMAQWARANKGGRDVRLCVSDETDVPVAVGLFDAMILIPRSLLESLSQAEVDQISLHELAHLRRADDWTNSLQRVIIALLGWNPAAQFIGQQLDLEREVACDDWVLSFGGAVRPYALCLTKMAESSSWPRQPMAAPGVFATRKHISLRIERLLRAGRNVATSLSLGPAAAAVAVVGALSLAIAAIAPSVAMPVVATISSAPVAERSEAGVSPHTAARAASTAKDTIRYVRVALAPSTASAPSAPVAPTVVPSKASPAARPTASPTIVHVPGTHVHVPGQTIHVPGVDVNVPGYSYKVPTPKVDVSGVLEGVNKSLGDVMTGSMNAANHAAAVAQNWQQNGERACSDCNFSGVNWAGRDLHGVTYSDVNLSRANLAGTNFSGSAFESVNLNRANLQGASFANAKLTDCNFTRANLEGVNFNGASLTDCQFNSANLASAQFAGATLENCEFAGADLANVDFSKARLIDTDLPERRGAAPPAAPPAPPPPR